MAKPYSESCEQNRAPILSVLTHLFADRGAVLEVGSGTGQHAVHFGEALPHLQWYTSDRQENHAGIRQWLEDAHLVNVHPPLLLDVAGPWPELTVDAVFSANTTHIMHWQEVESFFAGVGRTLPHDGLFALYGPFNYGGRYTSESNARFDQWLKGRDPHSGLRDFDDLDRLARAAGLVFRGDHEMPVNNRLLCWAKRA